ncbi:MAG: ABC transporter permease subunit, partial [Corallincola sp.]|nr:ABC transporter permease subunit [Corallincola sp.]
FTTIGIKLGFISLLLAHITFCLPFVVASVYARLRGFDHNIIDAARDLGATDAVIFRRILVPLAMPAIIGGWLLAFTLSLDDVIVSSFVTGPGYEILPLRIQSMVRVGVSPEINALATLLLTGSLVLVTLSQWLTWRVGRARPPSA